MNKEIEVCYICGNQLNGHIDNDHIPPKQFYAKQIRKIHNPNLFTLPVHVSCNRSYQKDEDYLIHSWAPLAKGSYSANAIFADINEQFKRPQGIRIGHMILKEFQPRPGGLYLPDGKVLKRFDGKRVWRVVWKITRGLFFKENGVFLPEKTPRLFKIASRNEVPPPELAYLSDTSAKGAYPAVFDYKFKQVPEVNNSHLWAMLFWDSLITIAFFHDTVCNCNKCRSRG